MSAPLGNRNNNKYNLAYSQQAHKLCHMGAREQDLAEFFEVHRDTIFYWVKRYPDFAKAKKLGN